MKYSACIEWLFAESGDFPERIRAARQAGLDGIEFWRWTTKSIDPIEAALDETGLALTGFVAEPMVPLTDAAYHTEFLEGLKSSIETARRLKAPLLIAQTGDDLAGRTRPEQRDALASCLAKAADVLKGSGVLLGIEPLNTRVDHKGYYLSSTVEGLDIVEDVGRPEIKIVYDLYHSAMMDEEIADVLAGRLDQVAHVHLADAPGRHEPGSGTLDWQRRIDWLVANGYAGMVGLEYMPTVDTVTSLKAIRGV